MLLAFEKGAVPKAEDLPRPVPYLTVDPVTQQHTLKNLKNRPHLFPHARVLAFARGQNLVPQNAGLII
ncbi:ADP-heptose:LPS heptosyltransferase II, partial [Pasteurella multocida subsp. multocida str. Anand1_buffalo]